MTFNSVWASALVSAVAVFKALYKVVDDDQLHLFLKWSTIKQYNPLTESYRTGRRNEPTLAWVLRATLAVPSLQPLFLI